MERKMERVYVISCFNFKSIELRCKDFHVLFLKGKVPRPQDFIPQRRKSKNGFMFNLLV